MIKNTSYDQLYDEHIYIFSLTSIELIAKKFGFFLYDAEKISTHGGSMRYFLAKKKNTKTNRLLKLIKTEKKFGIHNIDSLRRFANNCKKNTKKYFTTK